MWQCLITFMDFGVTWILVFTLIIYVYGYLFYQFFRVLYDLSCAYLNLISYLQPCSWGCGQKDFWSNPRCLPASVPFNLPFSPPALCFLQNLYLILSCLFWCTRNAIFSKRSSLITIKHPLSLQKFLPWGHCYWDFLSHATKPKFQLRQI